jgi:hypothetical protein
VQRRDRRLQDVVAAAAEGERALERGAALRDLLVVPQRAVLVAQEHDAAAGEARLATRVVHQHQREQGVDLGLVGHKLDERAAQTDCLRRQLVASAVALVEDQVDDREHRSKPVGQQVRRRHAERDAGGGDLLLGPHEALRHRRLGDEECARDLVGRQAAECAQRQRDLSVQRECRVAAGEDQLQALVGDLGLVDHVLGRLLGVEQPRLRGERAIPADAVDRAVARGRHEPRARVGGGAVARPALGGDRESILGGLLGELEVAEEADQGREHAPPLVAEGLLEDGYHSMTGRTSIAPPSRAAGMRDASSIAASRSSAS